MDHQPNWVQILLQPLPEGQTAVPLGEVILSLPEERGCPAKQPFTVCALQHAESPPDVMRSLRSPHWDGQGEIGMGRSTLATPAPIAPGGCLAQTEESEPLGLLQGRGERKARFGGPSGQIGMPVGGGGPSNLSPLHKVWSTKRDGETKLGWRQLSVVR